MSKLDFIVIAAFLVFVVCVALYTGAFDSLPWSRVPELVKRNG